MREGVLWWGWGRPAEAEPLPAELRSLLRSGLGITSARPAVGYGEVRLAQSRLSAETRAALGAIVGGSHVCDDRLTRLQHTRGKSTPDLLRIRAGDAEDAPDVVVAPGSHTEVQHVLELCSAQRLAVVPFGGGTSVVGGLAPRAKQFAGVVALDLGRLDRLLELDEVSRTALFEPGLQGAAAEHLLTERGYTLGHRPQSMQFASIGGFAATRSSGEASTGYGRFDDLVLGLRVATPRGTIELGRAPRSAAGPDLRQLFLGSEGILGVITGVRVEVRPTPEVRASDGWRLSSFAAGLAVLRQLVQDGPVPTSARFSDEVETALDLAGGDGSDIAGGDGSAIPQRSGRPASNGGRGCVAVLGFEGREDAVAERRAAAAAIMREAGARPEAHDGEAWLQSRYRTPYLRDALLDNGALVETLETATFWSGLGHLYEAVRTALVETLTGLGAPPVVLCHVSHLYRSGASLYFTVAAAQLEDPIAQWGAAKLAASDAIIAAGGTITHHHGIGRDHSQHYVREIGQLSTDVLNSVKRALDPQGILNPGVLLP